MWFPGSEQTVGVIKVQLIPVHGRACFLNIHKHPPRFLHFDHGGIQRTVCFEQNLFPLPFFGKRDRPVKLDCITVASFGNHVAVAAPLEDERVRQVTVELQGLGWTSNDTVLIHFYDGDVRAAGAVHVVFEKDVVPAVDFQGKRIGPEATDWRNEISELACA